MEIPVKSCVDDFELSIQNSSLLSRVLSVSGFESSSIWKVGALILAIVASFSTIVTGIKVVILKIKRDNSIASEPLSKFVGDYDRDDEGETCSSSSPLEDEGEEDGDDEEPESHRYQPMDEDFRVAGGSDHYVESYEQNRKSKFRRRFSWADFTGGKSVVKLWDNLGLGLDFNCDGDDSVEKVISVYDTNRDKRIGSVLGRKPAVASTSPSVIVTAASRDNGYRDGLSLRLWDTRVRCRIPAMLGQWRPQLGKIVGVGYSGVDKVYVRDDAAGVLPVGDIRKVRSPLARSDVDTWWDADAIIRQDVFFEE